MIYFNGDSNVAGTELVDPDRGITGCLARRLGMQYQNHAFGGASNDRIYDTTMADLFDRSTQKPLLKWRPDLVVIGWTQFNRIQWFLVDQWQSGEFWEINNIGVGIPLPENFQSRYQFWQEHVHRDGHWQVVMSHYWHNKIFNMHCLLDYFKIPHLFFNAFDCFSTENVLPEQRDWNDRFMSPYDQSLIYVPWCTRKGFTEITPGHHHFDETGQSAWADCMYDYIQQHQIL